MIKMLGSKIKRIALVFGIVYFAMEAYGVTLYVGAKMVLVLGFWLYHEIRLAKRLKANDSDRATI